MKSTSELHENPDSAAEMAANAVLHYMRECGIAGAEEEQTWVKKVFDTIQARQHWKN